MDNGTGRRGEAFDRWCVFCSGLNVIVQDIVDASLLSFFTQTLKTSGICSAHNEVMISILIACVVMLMRYCSGFHHHLLDRNLYVVPRVEKVSGQTFLYVWEREVYGVRSKKGNFRFVEKGQQVPQQYTKSHSRSDKSTRRVIR